MNWLIAAAVAVIVAIGVAWEVSIWQECRLTHSWLYCERVLSK